MATKTKPKQERKHLIFSDLELGSNCHEECNRQGECDCDAICIGDERMNLDKRIDGRILAIADIGRWNGRRTGYKILNNNIASILYSECDYVEWYSDGHNIKAKMIHHDGTNFIEYRVIREDRNIDNLLSKLYNGQEVTRAMINHYTKSLHPYIANVYGWSSRRK